MLDAEIVIAGGGPVGSLAAYLLATRGVDVVLIDENVEPVEDYRASTFHPPTLDLLERFGVTGALLEMGLPCPIVQYRDRNSGPVAELDLSVLAADTAHPYRLQCEQFKLVRWLQAELEHLPSATVLRSNRVTDVGTTADGVTVAIAGPAEAGAVTGRYAIAADGGRSRMRAALGIDFPGYTHPEQFLVAGTKYDFKAAMADIQSVNYTADPEEWFLLLEIPDMWRIVVPVAASIAADEARSDEYLQRCLNNICARPEPYEILVTAVYRVHQRVAETYRRESVFLAGDAAHVNNPLGGMGLNGGIHDALVLTDLLGDAVTGRRKEVDLDAYERQRRPAAVHDINATTERNKRAMEERDPAVRRARNERLRAICADPVRAREFALEGSMIASLRRNGLLTAA